MCVVLLTQELPFWHRTRMRCDLFTNRGMHTHVSWFSHEDMLKTDTEEKKLLNKVVIFVFFAHKNYYRSFIKLRLNYWCHMDYFNVVLTTFLGLERVSCVAVYTGSESSQFIKHVLIVFWRWTKVLRVGTTWRVGNLWQNFHICVDYSFKVLVVIWFPSRLVV